MTKTQLVNKLEKVNLSYLDIEKLTIPKFPSWFKLESRYSDFNFEYFTHWFLSPNSSRPDNKFDNSDWFCYMIIPTSWFTVIGKTEKDVVNELKTKITEDPEISKYDIELDSCCGVTRVSWLPFKTKEDKDKAETNNEEFNNLDSTKLVKELLCCKDVMI